ncbi:hypothetical protein R5R35_003411 [Gryllus longicercus]|uniref:Cytochrome P450 n=1 Tax=Gryllus longicercus TaxID=2509291 RepID=A0AAN9VUH7_9ORTH
MLFLQTFLTNSKNHSRPILVENALAYCIGRGLVTISGKEWSLHHKIVKPSFHQNLLKGYVPVFNQKGNAFVEHLAEYADGRVFDVKRMTEALESVIVLETLFGLSTDNKQTNLDQDFFELVLEMQRRLSNRLQSPWLYIEAFYKLTSGGRRAKAILKRFHEHLDEIVEQRKELLRAEAKTLQMMGTDKKPEHTPNGALARESDADANKKQYNILIDALLQEHGRSLSYESVLDELLTFVLAGFDTTSVTLQFAFYYLAKYPLVQEKAMRELQNIFDTAGSTEVTPDMLQRMHYVEMIVKETLRMHPPVFFTLKEAGVDTPLLSSDLIVPAGAKVVISPRSLHMDPKLYPDPHVFDPERFSPENSAKRHPYAFIPFLAGMRTCIGRKYAMMALKTVISKVIWKYRIQPDESYEPQFLWGISTVTTNGMRVKLTKR